MNKLDTSLIKRIFTASTFNKGEAYHKSGRVHGLQLNSAKNIWRATVSGSKLYTVQIELNGYDIDDDCNCPAHYSYGECQHVCATLLAIADEQNVATSSKKSGTKNARYRRAEELIDYFGESNNRSELNAEDEVLFESRISIEGTYVS